MDNSYKNWIQDLKLRIYSAQLKASVSVNSEMIMLYWDIGKSIVEKQNEFNWGSKIVEEMAKDLKSELPDTNGFSRSNLFAMRKFYLFYRESELVQQPVGLIENQTNLSNSVIVHQAGGQLNQKNI